MQSGWYGAEPVRSYFRISFTHVIYYEVHDLISGVSSWFIHVESWIHGERLSGNQILDSNENRTSSSAQQCLIRCIPNKTIRYSFLTRRSLRSQRRAYIGPTMRGRQVTQSSLEWTLWELK